MLNLSILLHIFRFLLSFSKSTVTKWFRDNNIVASTELFKAKPEKTINFFYRIVLRNTRDPKRS